MPEKIRSNQLDDTPEHETGVVGDASCVMGPTSKADVLDSEHEDEVAYARLVDQLEEEGRRLREELRAAQVAAQRRRWWVIGPRTSIY